MTRKNGDEEPGEQEEYNPSENDLQPEFCHYRDEGCDFATACLDCPFPQCLYEIPRGRQRWVKQGRNTEIIRLFSQGWKVKELAVLFGISQRTVQRSLKCNPQATLAAPGMAMEIR
ncbi:MAG: helix-turn-helix domain-containing protein [Dehalococcoidales bacterium]|nr:helix-turn-helix domain-containing protein [Dehalococcoidales bacterium]